MVKSGLWLSGALLLGLTSIAAADSETPTILPNLFPFPNTTGILKTFNATGKLDLTGPFFQSLGTNGRSCASCHQPGDAWSVSAAHVEDRFERSHGLDPIFRTNDGSNCDHNIDTATIKGRREAYSLLRTRGLIRIALAVPTGAEFEVVSVKNPYGCSETSTLSMYRRPLPSTNLRFLSTVMWDGRESSLQAGTKPITFATNPADLLSDLAHQSLDAVLGHAQATTAPTQEQQKKIVDFEMTLSTAQAIDFDAGALDVHGASGGPPSPSRSNRFLSASTIHWGSIPSRFPSHRWSLPSSTITGSMLPIMSSTGITRSVGQASFEGKSSSIRTPSTLWG